LAAALLALAGCGPTYEYAEVEGTVTLDGTPLSGVKVVFYPEAEGPEQPPYANGVTDDSGVYRLTAVTGKPGALVGKNLVVVAWPPQGRSADPDQPPPPLPGPPIPLQYTAASETPLHFDVKAGPRQTIDLPLKN
jgi:hypothetical protein